jgi:hypothetical protein
MRRSMSLLLPPLVCLLAVSASPAGASDWELLGEREVSYRTDRDLIRVTVSEGLFRKIKLDVLHNGIELLDLKVFFGNGRAQDVPVRRFIERGGETRIIDLVGGPRAIRTVQFVYRTRGVSPGRATVRLWGMH